MPRRPVARDFCHGLLDDHSGLTAIEQPELHLHPRLQCQLGDLIIVGALNGAETNEASETPDEEGRITFEEPSEGRAFLVETHSEHLVLRLMRRIRETTRGQPHNGIPITPHDVSVVYVGQVDGRTVVETIPIDEHGEFTREWPDNFFESDFYERIS